MNKELVKLIDAKFKKNFSDLNAKIINQEIFFQRHNQLIKKKRKILENFRKFIHKDKLF